MIRYQFAAKQLATRPLLALNLQLVRCAHHIPQSHFHVEPEPVPTPRVNKIKVRTFSSPSHFRLFWVTASLSAIGAYGGPAILCVVGPPLLLGSFFLPKDMQWAAKLGRLGKQETVEQPIDAATASHPAASELAAAAYAATSPSGRTSPPGGHASTVPLESTTHRAHQALYDVAGRDLKGLGAALRVDPHSLKPTEVESMSYGDANGEILDFGLLSYNKRIANVTVALNGHKTRLEVQPLGSGGMFIASSNRP